MICNGRGGGEVFNLFNFFMEIYKMGSWFSGVGGSDKDCYWDNVLCCLLNRMIMLLKLLGYELSIENMIVIMFLILNEDVVNEFDFYGDDEWNDFYKFSFCVECILDVGEWLEELKNRYENLGESYFNDFKDIEEV